MAIREAAIQDAEGIARVLVDTWRTTYAGIVPDDYLASLSYEEQAGRWARRIAAQDGSFAYVAEQEPAGIVGMVAGGPERGGDAEYSGEVYAIYVLAGHQRQGIGRGLMVAATRRLRLAGLYSSLVWVLKANAFASFYQALGGQVVRTSALEIGGPKLEELGYGWPDNEVILRFSESGCGGLARPYHS